VVESRQGEFLCATPAARARRSFEDLNGESGASERQRRGESVRSRSDNDGVQRRFR